MSKFIDLSGQRFGNWTALEHVGGRNLLMKSDTSEKEFVKYCRLVVRYADEGRANDS